MRVVASVLVCAGLVLALAGCDPNETLNQGVGTKLYVEETTTRTATLNTYVADICRQAGLDTVEVDGATGCGSSPHDPAIWWQFVQAGMNDIDQRCDSYLAWLDDLRRSRTPILNQISQTGTVVQNIMLAAAVHQTPITIAADAFGLAHSTFTNMSSRLLLEMPNSTIQAVVLSKQKEFRDDLLGSTKNKNPVAIVSRASAIYALRSYLRLCMPMTIETEINNTVATWARGGTDALDAGESLISAKSVGLARITDPNGPIPAAPRNPTQPPGCKGAIECSLSGKAVKAYQDALCVSPADGKFGPNTRSAISEYLKLKHRTDSSAEFNRATLGLLQDAVDQVASCRNQYLANVFEVVKYGMAANRLAAVKALQGDLNVALKKAGSPTVLTVDGMFKDDSARNDQTRNAIAEIRKIMNPNDAGVQDMKKPANREVDAEFLSSLFQ